MSILPINNNFNSVDTRTISVRDVLTAPRTETIGAEPVAAQGSLIVDTSSDTLYLSDGSAWNPVAGGGGGGEDFGQTLALGNTSDGTDVVMTSGDQITSDAELTLLGATSGSLATTAGDLEVDAASNLKLRSNLVTVSGGFYSGGEVIPDMNTTLGLIEATWTENLQAAITVTNSQVTADSIIILSPLIDASDVRDVTFSWTVVGAGSFSIEFDTIGATGGDPTASVYYLVINAA